MTADDSLHERPRGVADTMRAPAPWALRARGYLLAVRAAQSGPHASAEPLLRPFPGGLGFVLFVDYSEAPVGPYHELLFIPGTLGLRGGRLPTVSKIYVSTQASVDNGRRNWGIPKELARFDVRYGEGGVDRVRMQVGGTPVVELALAAFGLSVPVASWLLPKRLRSLGQQHEGRTFITRPRARGRAQPAKLLHAWADGVRFPPLDRVLASLSLTEVAMTFPEPEVA